MAEYTIRLDYSHFYDMDVVDCNGEEGIFIPIKKNNIHKYKGHLYQTLACRENKELFQGYTHFIIPYMNKDEYILCRKENKYPSIIGSMKERIPSFYFDKNKKLNSQKENINIEKTLEDALNK